MNFMEWKFQMNDEYDLIIATPGKDLHRKYVESLVKTINFLSLKGYRVYWANEYSSSVSFSRKITLDKFINYKYSKCVWIDSDISWEIDDFIKIISYDLPIVSGSYLGNDGECQANSFLNGRKFTKQQILENSKLLQIIHCGFGFVSIEKKVFDTLKDHFLYDYSIDTSKYQYDGKFTWPYCEDVSFFLKANNAGFNSYLDPKIKVIHHKEYVLKF